MRKNLRHNSKRSGVVLLVTMVVLVVLASIACMLTLRVSSQIHRNQYIIDYQNARYACDSALKYALLNMNGIAVKPIDRPNEPDFSDLFAFTQDEYERFIENWAAEQRYKQANGRFGQEQDEDVSSSGDANDFNMATPSMDVNDVNDPNLISAFGNFGDSNEPYWSRDPNNITIPGPYGPPWPLVMEPLELEIGNAKVTIIIEDENAKLPLVWGANSDKDKQQEVDAAMTTFCEWMNIGAEQMDNLKMDLHDIGQIKTYSAGKTEKQLAASADPNKKTSPGDVESRLSRRERTRRTQQQQAQQPQQQQQQTAAKTADKQVSDFVRLFHTGMLNAEPFAQPYIKTPERTESALKYMSRWGTTKVNINTAPRQVLEAAFMFGGDASETADEIIKARQIHPFADVNDLQKKIYKYADSIRKSKDFITATSNIFSIRITAISGMARTSLTAGVLMDGKNAQIIAILAEPDL